MELLSKIANFGVWELGDDGEHLYVWCDLDDGRLLLITAKEGKQVAMGIHDVGMPPYDQQKDDDDE
jgi:hypothetical protein